MSKVRTFSRYFPSYHPRAGEPTYFVEKIWESLIQLEEISISRCCELSCQTGIGNYTMNSIRKVNFEPKFHTIRAGHHFKPGDWFSPRVWSGKPYNSKQIIIAPDIQVQKVWDFYLLPIKEMGDINVYGFLNEKLVEPPQAEVLAKNDGLSIDDFESWFCPSNKRFIVNKPLFDGQIICWNESIEYGN